MSKINIKDQLICLRKLKGITQEELARQLGVTNQSVSKWEAGICCPDIQLLPDIAEYFNVSVDELLGCTKKEETEEEIMLSIKNIFKRTGKEHIYPLAFKFAAILHECAVTGGYKEYVPWDTDKEYDTDRLGKWGMSINNEREGSTMHVRNAMLFAVHDYYKPLKRIELKTIASQLAEISSVNTLRVLFALFELTYNDEYTQLSTIAEKSGLSEAAAVDELEKFPCETDEIGNIRLDRKYMHIPALLTLFLKP